jgi:5-methylcytosine-specific restriction endonuclease McrA
MKTQKEQFLKIYLEKFRGETSDKVIMAVYNSLILSEVSFGLKVVGNLTIEERKQYKTIKNRAKTKWWKFSNPQAKADQCARRNDLKTTVKYKKRKPSNYSNNIYPNDEVISQINYWNRLNKGICIYCYSKEGSQIDHFIPLSKGGVNNNSNMVSCCSVCNSKKARQLFETIDEVRFYIICS